MNNLLRVKHLVILCLLTIILLTACSAEGQTPVAEVSTPETESQHTPAVPTEVDPTETAVSESEGGVSAAGLQMECTLVSDQPDVPSELVAIFGVTEDDWIIGPDSAAVTFVEYSDFQ